MYLFEHIDPVVRTLITEGVLTPTLEKYDAKLQARSDGELELAVKRANDDGPLITDVALAFFWNLA